MIDFLLYFYFSTELWSFQLLVNKTQKNEGNPSLQKVQKKIQNL